MESVDAIDLRIIRCLQDDPRAAYSAVARQIGVSETTVKRRVDDLIANRIIQPAMVANMFRLGFRTRATIGLTVELNRMIAIAEELCTFPETTSVTITTGRFNITCFVVMPSLEALTRFLTDRIGPIEGVRSVEVMVVPRVLKVFADWRIPDSILSGADDQEMEDALLSNRIPIEMPAGEGE